MPTLKEILLVPGNRPKVVADCVTLIEEEVDSKGGPLGPGDQGRVRASSRRSSPASSPRRSTTCSTTSSTRLEPFWADAQAKNEPIGALMNARAGQVADALLAISDERAARAKNHGR